MGLVALGLGLTALGPDAPAFADSDDTWLGSTIAKVEGSPLEVGVGEGQSLHANLDGSGGSDVFWFDEAGLTLTVFENGGVRAFGTEAVEGDELRLVSLPTAGGSGTAADPWTITSVYDAGSPARLRVTQVVRFVEGAQRFAASYVVQNVSGTPQAFRAYVSAQIESSFSVPLARLGATGPASAGLAVALDGGTRDPNDPVFDGYAFGRAIDIEPDGPVAYRHAVAGEGVDAQLAISRGEPLPASLAARARYNPMLAADWDDHAPGHAALAPGATFSFAASFRLASALRTLPLITGARSDQPYTLQVRTDLADGGPLGARRLGWAVYAHGRDLFGTMTTDSAGRASLTWTADGELSDRVVVWIDSDGDGSWDRDTETTRQSIVSWDDPVSGDVPGSGTSGADVSATGGAVTAVTGGATSGGIAPGASAASATLAPSPRARVRLSAIAVRRLGRHAVRVSGRASPSLAGRLSLRLTTRSGRLLARGVALVRRGRFSVLLRTRPGPAVRRAVLTVRYGGDRRTAPLVARRGVAVGR